MVVNFDVLLLFKLALPCVPMWIYISTYSMSAYMYINISMCVCTRTQTEVSIPDFTGDASTSF